MDRSKTLFGYYRIKSESKLKKAAAKGGYKWELAKDIMVSSDIVVAADQALMINGKGHSVARTNGDDQSQIFDITDHSDLYIKSMNLVTTVGRCIRVNIGTKLCVDACDLQSAGDGIINFAKTWVCGGTKMKVVQAEAACIRNLKTSQTGNAETTLYSCDIDTLYNEGALTLMQNGSQINGVIANEESKVYSSEKSMNTLTQTTERKDAKK